MNIKYVNWVLFVLILCSSCTSVDKNNKIVLQNLMQSEIQDGEKSFSISIDRDTLIQGAQGSKVFIKENTFVDSEGNPVSGKVDISIKEIVSMSDILCENVSTLTKDGFLETRGMLKIEATQNGKEVMIGPNAGIEVFFPKMKEENKNMNLYYGVKENDGILTWERAGEPETEIKKLEDEIVKETAIWYEVGNDTSFYNDENKKVEKLLDSLISFTSNEKEELLYQRISIHWILFDDGDFEVYKIRGNLSAKRKKEIERKLNESPFIKPFKREGGAAMVEGVFRFVFKENNQFEYDNYYSLTTTQLGWINCDIFIQFDVPKTDMNIHVSTNSILKLKFKNYNTIVTGKGHDGKFYFPKVPKDEPIEIIAFDYKREGVQYSLTNTTVQESIKSLNPFETLSMDELKAKLKELK